MAHHHSHRNFQNQENHSHDQNLRVHIHEGDILQSQGHNFHSQHCCTQVYTLHVIDHIHLSHIPNVGRNHILHGHLSHNLHSQHYCIQEYTLHVVDHIHLSHIPNVGRNHIL